MAATSFTAAALIGRAPALEAQAIASTAARLRKKSVLRMDTSSGVPVGNDGTSLRFQVFAVRRASTHNAPQTEKVDVYLFQANLEPSYDNA
jgi:hypothetical protein